MSDDPARQMPQFIKVTIVTQNNFFDFLIYDSFYRKYSLIVDTSLTVCTKWSILFNCRMQSSKLTPSRNKNKINNSYYSD